MRGPGRLNGEVGRVGGAAVRTRPVVALVACACLAGCSLFVRGAPEPPPRDGPLECTTSFAAPTADLLGAAAATVLLALAAGACVNG